MKDWIVIREKKDGTKQYVAGFETEQGANNHAAVMNLDSSDALESTYRVRRLMKFNIPNYGTVGEDNAAFTMFLKRLDATDATLAERIADQKRVMRLEDIPVGGTAVAEFQNGMGSNSEVIRRLA